MAHITLVTPVVKDGVSYPFVAVQILVTPSLVADEAGKQTYVNRATFNFQPYRELEDGSVDALPLDYANPVIPPLLIADANQAAATDPALAVSLGYIITALQHYVTAANVGAASNG